MGERGSGRHLIAIALLLLISIVVTAFLVEGVNGSNKLENGIQAPIKPNVWIELERDYIEINVDTSSDDFHYVRGTIHCEIPLAAPPGYQVKVVMYSNFVGSYGFIFHRNLQQQEFQEVIPVSKGTSADAPTYRNYDGHWETESPKDNGPIEGVVCEIWALPFGEVHFPQVVGDLLVREDKWIKFEVPIENYGNCLAQITLSVEAEDGIEVDIVQPTIGIEQKLSDGFLVRVKVGSNAADTGNIRMTAVSSVQGTHMRDVYTIEYEKDNRVIGPFTAPMIIIFLSTFSLIVIVTLIIIFWRIRVSIKKETSIPYQ